ncbi:MAG TPA: hypothetical protein VG388_09360, partial [Solirubrobacteraceae bacterium]|nr:hypothetical protein [Solirubrobacteraceae bacterium]
MPTKATPRSRLARRARPPAPPLMLALAMAALIAGCGSASGARPGTVFAVGAENEYANVIGQIGGKYVTVTAI